MSTSLLPRLVGRRQECAVLDGLLSRLRSGQSDVRVIRGEPGAGKSVLLQYLVAQASGIQVARAQGVEADMELAWASLHQLCAPFLGTLDDLPGPQRDALRVAFGLAGGDPPDRFLVGLAVLTLLTRASATRPVIVVIDDAQWLDQVSLQTVEFVARRLAAEAVSMVFAVRDTEGASALTGLPKLLVAGLDKQAAGDLLDASVEGRLEEPVRDRLVAETQGNPLALLELCRGRSAAELAYGLPASGLGSVATRVEQDYALRLKALPEDTKSLLLLAAAEPVGDPQILLRAMRTLDLNADAAPAKAAGLIEFGEAVRFRHPLARSAIYRQATALERRVAHRALAEATDPVLDPDRRAWHAAHACQGPDEQAAAGLERAADRARQRGGMAAEAVLLERAAALTPDPWRRGRRALAAAEAHLSSAAPAKASELAALADLCPLSVLNRARLGRLRARMLFDRNRSEEAARLLLGAATQFATEGSPLARETHLEALGAAVFCGRVHGAHGARAVALAARTSGAPPSASPAADLLLEGVSTLLSDGPERGLPALRDALEPLLHEELTTRDAAMRWLLSAPVAVESFIHHCWDMSAAEALSVRAVRLAREIGALGVLPTALTYNAGVHIHHGDFGAAARMIEEANAIASATGQAPNRFAQLVLTAWTGDETAIVPIVEHARARAAEYGEVSLLGLLAYAQGVLLNGLARYEEALEAARAGVDQDGYSFTGRTLAEHIEAAARCGETEAAHRSFERLVGLTSAAGTGWARGIRQRCEAMLAEDLDEASHLYQAAIDGLSTDSVHVEVARSHLLYGERLRRSGHRADAREHLKKARRMFGGMGAAAFAERARRELQASGEHLRAGGPSSASQLTPQEAQIAALAASGMTNSRIASELFLSPHTIEWHLRKVFSKLDISTRREIRAALSDQDGIEPSGGSVR